MSFQPVMTESAAKPVAAAVAVFACLATWLLPGCRNESTESLLASARSYEAKGDTKAAIVQLRNALAGNPDNGEARRLLGQALLQIGDSVGAEKELRKALEYRQSPAAVVPWLARAMLEQDQAGKVIEEFASVKLAEPGAQSALLSTLGEAQLRLGDPVAARGLFEAAVALDAGAVSAQLGLARVVASEGKIDDAVRLVDGIVAAHPKSAEAFALQAELRMAQGKVSGANESLERAIAADGSFLPARYALVQSLISQRQFDAAAAQLDAARKQRGGDLRALYFESAIAFGKADLPKARDTSQQLLKRAPEHVPTLVLAGAIELQAGQNVAAETYLRKAVALAPQNIAARRMLVRTYLGSQQPAKALEVIQPFLEADAQLDPQLQLLIGEVFLANGDLKRATQYYSAAGASGPQAPLAQTRLGIIALASGDPDAGIRELEAATSLDGAPIQADMALIVGYVRKNDLDKALEAARAFVTKNPKNPLAQQVLGAVYAARKNTTAARDAYASAVELSPTYLPAVANLARLDLQEGKPADARKRFELLVKKEPNNERALLGLAEVLVRTGAPAEEVGAILQRAIAANPQGANARLAWIAFVSRSKDPRAALAAAQDAAASVRDDPRILGALAQAQENAGDVNQAIETYNRIAAANPQSAAALVRLATLYTKRSEYSKAIDTLRRAQKVAPQEASIARDLVYNTMLAGRPDEALREAKALQSGKDVTLGFALEGDVYAATRRLPEAERAFRSGLKHEPDSGMLVLKLYGALVSAGKAAEADSVARQWLGGHPRDTLVRTYLAERALEAKNYQAAASYYQAIIRKQPDNAVALNNLAWVAGQLNDPKAISYAQRAVQLAPSAPALDTLGVLLVAKGDPGQGADVLAKAVALAPQRYDIRLNYAKALIKAGRLADARKELTALQAVSEDFPGKAEVAGLIK